MAFDSFQFQRFYKSLQLQCIQFLITGLLNIMEKIINQCPWNNIHPIFHSNQ